MRRFLMFLLFLPVACPADTFLERGKELNAIYDMFKHHPSESLEKEGSIFLEKDERDSAFICFTLITSRYSTNMDSTEKHRCARAYNYCGLIYFFSSDYPKAYITFLKALEVCEESDYASYSPTIYSNISSIFGNYGDYAKAAEYFEKAYDQSLQSRNWSTLPAVLLNLINLYLPMDSLENIEDKMYEFTRMDIPHESLHDYTMQVCKGALNILNRNYEEAIGDFSNSLHYTDSLWMSVRYIYGAYSKIAKTYTLVNRYDSAISFVKKGEAIAQEHDIPDLKIVSYKSLADYYDKTGNNDMALKYKLEYYHLRDSLFNAKELSRIKDMQSLYEIEKIENRIYELTVLQKSKDRILAISLTALAIIALLLFWVYRQNRRLAEKNRKLFSNNVIIMASEEAEKRMRQEYETQAKEYKSKAKEYEQLLLDVNSNLSESPTGNDPKYRSSVLSEEHKDHLLGIIRQIMDEPQVFCSSDFTIEKLASLAGTKHKYISQVINEKLGKNFNTFLSEYRISEARKRLMDFENYGNITIEAIAESLGFKSRGNFNQTFKKITGLTPTEYQKMAKPTTNKQSF